MKIYKAIFFPLLITCCFVACFSDAELNEPQPIHKNPAIDSLSQQIKMDTNNLSLYLNRAQLFEQEDLMNEAIDDLKKVITLDATKLIYRHKLADFYFDTNKDNEAISLLEETLLLFPKHTHTYLKLSEYQYILEMNAAALQTIKRLMNFEPNHTEGYYMLGKIYNQKQDTTLAIQNFKKVLSLQKEHLDALIALGHTLALSKNKNALQHLSRALKISPKHPDILFNLGEYYRYQKNDEKALNYYKEVVLLDHQYTDAHLNAGLIYINNKAYKKANKLFNIALQTNPSDPSVYYYRGLSYTYLNNISKAKHDLQQALTLAPSYQDAAEALRNLNSQ